MCSVQQPPDDLDSGDLPSIDHLLVRERGRMEERYEHWLAGAFIQQR